MANCNCKYCTYFIHDTKLMASEELSALALETQSMASAHCHELGAVKLHIAVTGESGSGKSSFVNALRGLGDEEEISAKTGVVEITMEPTAYLHPKHPNIIIWDLPGIGTPRFRIEDYLTKVQFQRFDFFILVASERFKSSSVYLAKQIEKTGKRFYFIRSKIDDNICAEKRKRNFNQELTLSQIRQDCMTGLAQSGVESPVVFLISSHERGSYDFSILQEMMERDLTELEQKAHKDQLFDCLQFHPHHF